MRSLLFALSLSVCVDIYSVYGAISKILQIVSILPHVRLDMFNKQIMKMKYMEISVRLEDCPCMMFAGEDGLVEDVMENSLASDKEKTEVVRGILAEVCYWPALHSDIRQMMHMGLYRGQPLGQLTTDSSRTRVGSQVAKDWLKEDRKSTAEKVYKRGSDVVSFLAEGLEEKVFDRDTIDMINHSRKLLNLESEMIKIKTNGAANVCSLGWRGFRSAATYFEPAVFSRVPEAEMRLQYREFIRRLGEVGKEKGSAELTSIQIIAKFLDPKEDLYKDIEGPLSVLARACVAQGVEAIVESWVSVLENHSSSVRGITDQDRLEDEVWVAINGPEVVHCEGIVREAIRVGEGGGHFIRRGGNIKSYGVSKAVDSLVKKPPKVPFML